MNDKPEDMTPKTVKLPRDRTRKTCINCTKYASRNREANKTSRNDHKNLLIHFSINKKDQRIASDS